jgi:hypothetical protein
MGLAMAQQLLAAGHDLLTLSRKANDALAAQATQAGRQCEQWPQDLARAETAAARLETWLQAQDRAGLASLNLGDTVAAVEQFRMLIDSVPLAGAGEEDLEVDFYIDRSKVVLAGLLRAQAGDAAAHDLLPREACRLVRLLGRAALPADLPADLRRARPVL